MPVYEYRCNGCQKIFEYQQRMVEPAKTTCEECAGALERLISRSSFSFKGGGWYKDLYASAKSSNDGGDAKPATTSDSKPAAAAASSDSGGGGGSAAAPAAGPAT